jgi:hypothetical protein
MTDKGEGPDASAGVTERVLLCSTCGRCSRPSMEELLRYTRVGWPRCCGEVMVFSIRVCPG